MLPSQTLKALIDNLKISYVDLEKKTGISKSAIQRYASGSTRKIPISAIETLASALGTTPAYIMGWDDLQTEAQYTPYLDEAALEDYIGRLGYRIGGDSSEGYLWIEFGDNTYEITDGELKRLEKHINAYVKFYMHELLADKRCLLRTHLGKTASQKACRAVETQQYKSSVDSDAQLEKEADEFAAMAREQYLKEKRAALPASYASEFDVG